MVPQCVWPGIECIEACSSQPPLYTTMAVAISPALCNLSKVKHLHETCTTLARELSSTRAWSARACHQVSLPILSPICVSGMLLADLKAENVLLQKVPPTEDNPIGLIAKVADFGLAQVRSQ